MLGGGAAMLLQERPVDQLDMDAAVLHGLNGIGDLHRLSRGGFRIGKGARLNIFVHRWGSGRCEKLT